ncbi:MAG TPA: lytic transglycosylase domain-containing protein, partial [Gemmatimonadaceae bacterium]|nr:lytic transglycosylase domain-containing protein [Gemmatimonadaceae bacterium]
MASSPATLLPPLPPEVDIAFLPRDRLMRSPGTRRSPRPEEGARTWRDATRFVVRVAMGALATVAGCAPAIRPTQPPAVPSARGAEASAAALDSSLVGSRAGSAASAPALLVPDSVNAALTAAIRSISSVFDVPDSVLSGKAAARVFDVDSTSNVGGEPAWDIEVDAYATQEKVARYVDLFLGTARGRFVERLQRGKQYEPMIRETFRVAGIPEDMYFLGLVESGFDPHAYSRAAAVGMWQFMSSTARGVGLRVDWWVDERRDPVRSTEAAARFIRELRGQFGSLYLAAAAYNGGPGRVSRGLKKFDEALESVEGEDCFFALAEQDYLRAETKNYVPQLIAAAIIGKTPERYGIALDSVPRYAYDSVMVPGLTPVAAVARAVGHTVREVQTLNPHLLRGVTPPDAPTAVRIPVGTGGAFDSAFAALAPHERVAFARVSTKKGESLASIA